MFEPTVTAKTEKVRTNSTFQLFLLNTDVQYFTIYGLTLMQTI